MKVQETSLAIFGIFFFVFTIFASAKPLDNESETQPNQGDVPAKPFENSYHQYHKRSAGMDEPDIDEKIASPRSNLNEETTTSTSNANEERSIPKANESSKVEDETSKTSPPRRILTHRPNNYALPPFPKPIFIYKPNLGENISTKRPILTNRPEYSFEPSISWYTSTHRSSFNEEITPAMQTATETPTQNTADGAFQETTTAKPSIDQSSDQPGSSQSQQLPDNLPIEFLQPYLQETLPKVLQEFTNRLDITGVQMTLQFGDFKPQPYVPHSPISAIEMDFNKNEHSEYNN